MGKLTIQEIAKVLVSKNGLQQSEANRFATELFAIVQERLEKNDLVKVKGLGTFKVITVEARESVSVRTGGRVMIGEHSKITFTPDTTMKELVNKPFSQFETVPLNDNVEFDDLKEQTDDSEFEDIKDDLTEEELIQLEQMDQPEEVAPKVVEPAVSEPVMEEPVAMKPVLTEPIKVAEQPVAEEPQEEPVEEAQEVPHEEAKEEAQEEPQDNVEETSELVDFYDNEEEPNKWSKWLWIAFGAICIACLSAFGGYYYGCQQTALLGLGDTVVVRDTVYMAAPQDTTKVETPAQPDEQKVAKVEEPKQEAPKAEEPKVEKPKAETPKVEKPKAEPAADVDKYAQKDERVRLGAYRIVGLDHEVTVQQGQTFYSICRAHLGPDMECYIEVYNNLPRNPQIKAGQVIKIPKLQLKKRKKQ